MAKIILPDQSAKRIFVITFVGMLVIFFLSFFVYSLYMQRISSRPSRHFVASHFSKVVRVLKLVPPEQLKDNLQLLAPRYISLKLVNRIGPQMHLLKHIEPAKL